MIIANHLGSEASIASSSFSFTVTTLLELYLNLSYEYLEVMGCALLSRDVLATQNESSTMLHFQFENNIQTQVVEISFSLTFRAKVVWDL